MRIFLTGGSGYIGAAVLDAFVKAGHRVEALVRNSEKAAQVQARGAQPVLGDLSAPASYADAAAAADGVVHTAIEYSPRGPQIDATVIDTLLAPTGKSGRFIIYTSGVWVLGPAPSPVDETAPLNAAEISAWRPAHEARVLAAETAGIRPVVIRPGVVYGGGRGIVGDLFKDAANSLIRIIGPGDNHWPLVYDRDLADLYVRVAANADASGVFHANDEGDETVNDIVEAIAGHAPTSPSIRHVPIAEARQKMGPYADALALDQIVRSPRARAIGWNPSLHSVAGNAARLFEEWRRARDAAA
ncbi:MAG TPA: NAD-dependent epimerase/dehydratase family protein [Vicinamibacterales bacterium]